MLYFFLRFVHIAAMASWFGSIMMLTGDIRRSVELGPPHIAPLVGRVRRSVVIATGSGWTTVLTGVALIFDLGGFGAVPVAIHVGLVLGLCLVGVGAFMGRTWDTLLAKHEAGDHAAVGPLLKRMSMLGGIFQLVWTVILGLMVFRAMV